MINFLNHVECNLTELTTRNHNNYCVHRRVLLVCGLLASCVLCLLFVASCVGFLGNVFCMYFHAQQCNTVLSMFISMTECYYMFISMTRVNRVNSGMTEGIEVEELNEYLWEFILYSMKRKDGKDFEPSSLRDMLSSFNRHLKECHAVKLSLFNSAFYFEH